MENEFDKTIDALLRNARDPSGAAVSGMHLDADELSMFAENASPAAFRQKQAAHLANCENCRNVLAQLISLNADKAEPVLAAPEIHTETVNAIPWYRRLFIYPNIAYVMGSLVVVFGGLLVFSIIQTSSTGEVSRSAEKFPQSEAGSAAANRSVPAAPRKEDVESSDSAVASNTSANANSNSATSSRTQRSSIAAEPDIAKNEAPIELSKDKPAISAAKPNENGFVLDGSSGVTAQAPARSEISEREDKRSSDDMRVMSAPAPPPKAKVQTERKNARSYSEPATTINGQRFVRKDGVWYDVRYNGQPTIHIRRNSSEYKKLDSGLKDIAEKLDAAAVILWKEKAYRISADN